MGPLAAGGEEYAASVGGGGGRRGKVRAADYAELDDGVDDEGETDGVLLATEETLRPIYWVKRPHPCTNIRLPLALSVTRR